LAFALIIGVGAAGWFGVDRFVTAAEPVVEQVLPALGNGLPVERLERPAAWRKFKLAQITPEGGWSLWADLDQREIRVKPSDPAAAALELRGDDVFGLRPGTTDWVVIPASALDDIVKNTHTGIEPLLLTDVVPPAALKFVTVTTESETAGVRVYDIIVDTDAFSKQRPTAFRRWASLVSHEDDTADTMKISVRADGYVIAVNRGDESWTWEDFSGLISLESPLAANRPEPTVATPVADPTAPASSVVVD
jgi:hypothetical protein